MSQLSYALALLFLPLFPFSMVFNTLLARTRSSLARGALLLTWPQLGLALIFAASGDVPSWVVGWALFTAVLYGLRALALREVGLWIGYLATSAWSLLWILTKNGVADMQVHFYALGFSAPLALLAILVGGLEQRYGAAYTGVYGGLAQTIPRFSGVLVFVVLAVIATPLFPTFFTMVSTIVTAAPGMPVAALTVAVVWLLWSWAGARLLHGLVVGPPREESVVDLSRGETWGYVAALTLIVVAGLYWVGDLR